MSKFYYDQIKQTNSDMSDVDNFYNNTLGDYFPTSQLYGIEQESRLLKELGFSKKTDFTIRCVRNGQLKKVVVIECNRRSLETQDAEWRAALNQGISYVTLIRTERDQTAADPVHIIVAIGTHLRAFTHNQGATDAVAFHLYPNELLELAKDEQKVHEIFTELNHITQH